MNAEECRVTIPMPASLIEECQKHKLITKRGDRFTKRGAEVMRALVSLACVEHGPGASVTVGNLDFSVRRYTR